MKRNRSYRLKIVLVLLALLAAGRVWGEEAGSAPEDFYLKHMFWAGYRAVSTQDNPRRAAEYSFLRSSVAGGLEVVGGRGTGHFFLDAAYFNEAEYRGEAHLDKAGLLRLNLRTESLFHNLDHIPYESRPDAFTPVQNPLTDPPTVRFTDQDPGDDYFVEVEQNEVALRAKPRLLPMHLNLRYWNLERSGRKQLRFVDEGGGATPGSCTQCHMQSKSRTLDRLTEEVSGGVDAHLGPIDLIFEQLYRQFRDREPTPVDTFGSHLLRSGPADRQHDSDPDSRLIASTVKAHTTLSGGVVGAASFTIGKRENQSDLGDVRPVESETDFKKGAGDLTLIPFKELTLNFRYRLLDMDNSNNAQITADGLVFFGSDHNPVAVRDNIDLRRATYFAAVTFRPSRKVTLKGEFEREEIHRGNTGGPDLFNAFAPTIDIDPVWELPEDENIDRYRVSLYARPLGSGKLRLTGWYQFLRSDDPAYGASVERGHQGFAGINLALSPRFGAAVHARAGEDRNTDHAVVLDDGTLSQTTLERDRRRERQDLTGMLWLNPVDALSLGVHYGYLRTRILQDLIFGTDPALNLVIPDEEVEYSQRVQTATATVNLRLHRRLQVLGEGRYIRSFAQYDPSFFEPGLGFNQGDADPANDFTSNVDSSTLRQLSQIDIRQYGLSAGLDWTPVDGWGFSVRYTYDDYDDLDGDVFDGIAQTYLVSLSRSW